MMTLHALLDWHYGADGDAVLHRMVADGTPLNEQRGPIGETPLHVATRRRRTSAVACLLDHGAAIDAVTSGGKTAYAHAVRRGFDDVAAVLRTRGAHTTLSVPDQVAVALSLGELDRAQTLLAAHPDAAHTGNPEEDRLLADMAGRGDTQPVALLVQSGAPLDTPGLDGGTPLHQAAWFGQPDNARILLEAGAPLEVFDAVHGSSPLGWAVHGSRYSGGAAECQDAYVAITQLLLEAGAFMHYPGDAGGDAYLQRLLNDASPRVRAALVKGMSR